MILNKLKLLNTIHRRNFKNFGHKHQPVPGVTILWHGFLTFSFIGLGIEWKKIAGFIFGEDHGVDDAPWELVKEKEPEKEKEEASS